MFALAEVIHLNSQMRLSVMAVVENRGRGSDFHLRCAIFRNAGSMGEVTLYAYIEVTISKFTCHETHCLHMLQTIS
jgi:hypothetical protein